MLQTHDLRSIPDDELLRRLSDLLSKSRRVESDLVAHIGEVDERRLYAREASPSMFSYCTEVLHLSEREAYLRITVARASRRHPMLLEMLSDGRLHLTAISLLASHLTEKNRDTLLARAYHKSKRQIEELLAEISPKPDVPMSIRKLPTAPLKSEPLVPQSPPTFLPTPACTPSVPPTQRPVVKPLSPARYKVEFTASSELREKLERLQALLHVDLAEVIDVAVTEKLERVESKRYGLTKSPRKSLEEADTSRKSRYIPAPVRRAVRKRDGGRVSEPAPVYYTQVSPIGLSA